MIVADISMPVMSGIEAIEALRSASAVNERSGAPRAVVFLTNHDDSVLIERALAAGALGYVLKPRAAFELLPAIAAASSGQRFVSAPIDDEQ